MCGAGQGIDLYVRAFFSCPAELELSSANGIVISEVHEGSESAEFWEGVGGRRRLAYDSLLVGNLAN